MLLGSGVNLITTVIGFGLSATFIIFICTRLIYGRIRRMRSRRRFDLETRIDLQLTEHGINDIESVKDAGISIVQFNREYFSSSKDTVCTICLAEYQEKETLRIMPKCGHNFHLYCIDIWLRKHSTCPVCRLSIQDWKRAPSPAMLSASVPSVEHSRHWLLPTTASNTSRDVRGNPVFATGIGAGSRQTS